MLTYNHLSQIKNVEVVNESDAVIPAPPYTLVKMPVKTFNEFAEQIVLLAQNSRVYIIRGRAGSKVYAAPIGTLSPSALQKMTIHILADVVKRLYGSKDVYESQVSVALSDKHQEDLCAEIKRLVAAINDVNHIIDVLDARKISAKDAAQQTINTLLKHEVDCAAFAVDSIVNSKIGEMWQLRDYYARAFAFWIKRRLQPNDPKPLDNPHATLADVRDYTVNATPHCLDLGHVLPSGAWQAGVTIAQNTSGVRVNTANDVVLTRFACFNIVSPSEHTLVFDDAVISVVLAVKQHNEAGRVPFVVVSFMAAKAIKDYLASCGLQAIVCTPKTCQTTDGDGRRVLHGAVGYVKYVGQ
ncbi:MAG: hypothetical protein KatS3mg087_1778 [Patescibacteria group bacterium]|nr:MAG: hypothetical protein KatS3mg087_1778 [Patescibacteria group bacterium]